MSETALAEREPQTINAAIVTSTMEALKTIREFVAKELKEGTDFGAIPGMDEKKKVMLLPGAQKVNMLYNCYPRYSVTTHDLGNGHVEFQVITELVNRTTDSVVGSGIGSCATMESKYRWRKASRSCPRCGKESIIKGREEFGGGWLCFAKKGGCGAKFKDDDDSITSQVVGRVENQDIYDVRNTVLKIAKKRSLVDASIGLGCLTELFTQDLEADEPPHDEPARHEPPRQDDDKPFPEIVKGYIAQLHDRPDVARLNEMMAHAAKLTHKPTKAAIWTEMQAYVRDSGIKAKFDEAKRQFVAA